MNSVDDYFLLFSVLKRIDVAICCDSFLHHLIEAVDSKAKVFVLWGGTLESNQGYENQVNIRKQKVDFVEPLRLPHNHNFYVARNFGCNDFGIREVQLIRKDLK